MTQTITLQPGESITITAAQSSGGGGGEGGGGSGGGDGGGGGSGGGSGGSSTNMGWGNNRVIVPGLPVSLSFTTGNTSSGASLPFVSGAEYGSAPSPMYAVLSETAGDFDHPVGGPMGTIGSVSGPSNSITLRFALGTGTNGYYPTLKLNTTYYVNVRDAEGTAGQRFFDLSVNSL